jgi:hypothetical protein
VLILPGEWGWGLAVPAYANRTMNHSLDELWSLMARRPDLRFIIKPHPRFHAELTEYARAAQNTPNLELADPAQPLAQALEQAGEAVFLNSCSQSLLETALAGVPGVFHRPGVLQARCTRSVMDRGHVPVTTTARDLENTLDTLRRDPDRRAKALADLARFTSRYAACADPDQVAGNTLAAIDALCARTQSARSAKPGQHGRPATPDRAAPSHRQTRP